SAAVQNSYLYDAWGQVRSQTGSLTNPFSHTSREAGEAGLNFYRARYYQPSIGRFLSEDAFNEWPSLYAYVRNHPVEYRDPSGNGTVNNKSCLPLIAKPETGPGLITIPPGGHADVDGVYNVTPNSCIGFCDRGGNPTPEARKFNNNTNVTVTGGCHGDCLKFSYSDPMSANWDWTDPRTGPVNGWKDGDWFDRHPDWPKPPP